MPHTPYLQPSFAAHDCSSSANDSDQTSTQQRPVRLARNAYSVSRRSLPTSRLGAAALGIGSFLGLIQGAGAAPVVLPAVQSSGVAANDGSGGASSMLSSVEGVVEGAMGYAGEVIEFFFDSAPRGPAPVPVGYTQEELRASAAQGVGWLQAADRGTTRRPRTRMAAQVTEVTEEPVYLSSTQESAVTPENGITESGTSAESIENLESVATSSITPSSSVTDTGDIEFEALRKFNSHRPIYLICENNSWGSWFGAEWTLNGQAHSARNYCVNQGRGLIEIPAGAEYINVWYQQGAWSSYYDKQIYSITPTSEGNDPVAVILGTHSNFRWDLSGTITAVELREVYKQITGILIKEGITTYYRSEDAGKILTRLISSIERTTGYETKWGFAEMVREYGKAALAAIAPPPKPHAKVGPPETKISLPSQHFDGQVRRV